MATDEERAIERLRYRAELRSAGELEDTAVIEQKATERVGPSSSTPAPAKGIVAILHTLPPWSRVFVVLGLLAVIALAITRGMRLW